MANNAQNVSFGKPKATGAIYIAPAGTTLPTDATSALDSDFVSLGYISEDGLVDAIETDTVEIVAWGGDTVLTGQTTFAEKFTFNMLELNSNALELYYGADNVNDDGAGNIAIKVNSKPVAEVIMVAEIVLTGGRAKRIVVPHAQFFDRSGEINHVDGEAIMYPVQLLGIPDASGDTSKQYISVVQSSS